jgi:cell wall-associated NlpC family hydrolase
VGVLGLGLVPITSGAQTIAQTQAEIASLSSELSQQEKTSEITANEYDAAKVNLENINANIASLQTQEANKRVQIAQTSDALQQSVVRAYVYGSADAQIESLFNQNVTSADARNVYEEQVVGNLNQLRNQYEQQKKALDTTISQVAVQQAKAQQQNYQLQALLAENLKLQEQTQATLKSVTAQLKTEIINYEIAAGVAAAKAHNSAGEEEAVNAASAVGGQTAANEVTAAINAAVATLSIGEIAGTAQGLLAVKYAESQIGVPYVWGGETAGSGFDCSGLVQWAWAKAGIAIPRTTQTQWPALQHVALSALQPGDLLFYYNLDGDNQVDHVVMYVGSGPWGTSTIIAAAHTGTNIALAPIFMAGLIGAARP